MAENPLSRLENSVSQVVTRAKSLESENVELRERIDTLVEQLEELKRENLSKGRDIKHMQQERLEIRSRVKRIREKIATLEAPMKESAL